MKRNNTSLNIDPAKAMEMVAAETPTTRRDFRLEIGRKTFDNLTEELANFFYGECMVFSQVSEEVNAWIQTYFVEEGGNHKNIERLKELFEFYQALTSDVDIRYNLVLMDSGDYDIQNVSIIGNDFYIPRR